MSLRFSPDLKTDIAAPSPKSGSGDQNLHSLVGAAAEKPVEKGEGK